MQLLGKKTAIVPNISKSVGNQQRIWLKTTKRKNIIQIIHELLQVIAQLKYFYNQIWMF